MKARSSFLIFLAASSLAISLSLPLFAAEQVATLEPDDTAVTFFVEATGHEMSATTRSGRSRSKLYLRSGEIRLDPATGLAAGELVIDATRAESGSKKRDKAMHKKVLESEQHPWISFKAERYEGELAASSWPSSPTSGVRCRRCWRCCPPSSPPPRCTRSCVSSAFRSTP